MLLGPGLWVSDNCRCLLDTCCIICEMEVTMKYLRGHCEGWPCPVPGLVCLPSP